jgi:hypothetical protein
MDIMKYIVEEALILIPVLLILGTILKETKGIPNWTIPWILLIFGSVASMFLISWTVQAVLQGILVTGAAVYVHQLTKQTIEKK